MQTERGLLPVVESLWNRLLLEYDTLDDMSGECLMHERIGESDIFHQMRVCKGCVTRGKN